MNDSKILNEKEETKTGLNQASEAPKDGAKTIIGTVTAITEKAAIVEFDKDNGSIPLEKLGDGVEIGDTIEATIKEINGKCAITDVVSHKKAEAQKDEKKESTIVSGEIVSLLVDGDVTIKFGNNGANRASVPYSKFENKPMVGDTVKVRLEEMNGSTVVTDIVSHESKNDESANNAQEKSSDENDDKNLTDEEIELSYIDPEFLLDCMSIPTHSNLEYRMVAYVIMWARRNGIQYDFDEFGNVYLTKGKLDDGEFYPCVTSHLDTVQYKHDPYIYAGVPLELQISIVENEGVKEHKVSVNNEGGSEIGIGADDKGGICICLSMFEHVEKLKACFFLDEETGCHGSNKLDEDWFKDVGYVIGFDSPDLYRAAWACDGTQLFNYEFYEKHMKKVCDYWGLTKGCFFSEPYTDVKNIREKTELICMNFGNGGYNAHNMGGTEYCIMEHMDQACGMGIDLIEAIGNTRHTLKHTGRYNSYSANPTTDYTEVHKLEQLGDNTRKGYKPTGSTSTSTSTSTTSGGSSTTQKQTVSKDDEIKFETVKYITERYDSLIKNIEEDVLATVKNICETNNIDFSMFEKSISENFSSEIKF